MFPEHVTENCVTQYEYVATTTQVSTTTRQCYNSTQVFIDYGIMVAILFIATLIYFKIRET